MALHNGLDTVAIISFGVFTKTYGSSDPSNIANLFASRGFLEDSPSPSVGGDIGGIFSLGLGLGLG